MTQTQFPLWKYIVIAIALVIGTLYSLPNLYGEDPSVQITGTHGAVVDDATFRRIDSVIANGGLEYKSVERGR